VTSRRDRAAVGRVRRCAGADGSNRHVNPSA
jgi:hypothetical protein